MAFFEEKVSTKWSTAFDDPVDNMRCGVQLIHMLRHAKDNYLLLLRYDERELRKRRNNFSI